MAESEGFEPPIALRLCLISSQVHSTGLCQLSCLSSLLEIVSPEKFGSIFGANQPNEESTAFA
jgi:hypothetical protein